MEVIENCLSGNLIIKLQSFSSFNARDILPDFLLKSDSNSLIDFEESYKLNSIFNLILKILKILTC